MHDRDMSQGRTLFSFSCPLIPLPFLPSPSPQVDSRHGQMSDRHQLEVACLEKVKKRRAKDGVESTFIYSISFPLSISLPLPNLLVLMMIRVLSLMVPCMCDVACKPRRSILLSCDAQFTARVAVEVACPVQPSADMSHPSHTKIWIRRRTTACSSGIRWSWLRFPHMGVWRFFCFMCIRT